MSETVGPKAKYKTTNWATWLSADPVKASELMTRSHMPELRAMAAPRG
jgi:hypothetical protein